MKQLIIVKIGNFSMQAIPQLKQLIWGCTFHPRYIPAPKEGIIEETQYVADREEELNRLFDEGEAGE